MGVQDLSPPARAGGRHDHLAGPPAPRVRAHAGGRGRGQGRPRQAARDALPPTAARAPPAPAGGDDAGVHVRRERPPEARVVVLRAQVGLALAAAVAARVVGERRRRPQRRQRRRAARQVVRGRRLRQVVRVRRRPHAVREGVADHVEAHHGAPAPHAARTPAPAHRLHHHSWAPRITQSGSRGLARLPPTKRWASSCAGGRGWAGEGASARSRLREAARAGCGTRAEGS